MDRLEARSDVGASSSAPAAAVVNNVVGSFVFDNVVMYQNEELAFDKMGMRYISRHNMSTFRMQLRKQDGRLVVFYGRDLQELKQLRLQWCKQHPESISAIKANKLYHALAQDPQVRA